MFEFIGDVIGAIGDGISWVWDHTIGAVAGAVGDAIWDQMFEWVFNTIYGAVADLFEFINETTSDIFRLGWVQAFVTLFQSLGFMLFVVGMLVAVFDTAVAYENGSANIKNTCFNVLKGFMAASLFAVIPPRLYELCVGLQGSFSNDLLGVFITGTSSSVAETGLEVIVALASDVSLFSLFFIILFGYCTIKVIFANIKRGGIILCQIAIGSLYMFSVPRGYVDGFTNWCKQVIATCVTAFLQTIILYLGLLTYTQHALLAVGICLSATEVPRIAQMYGLETSIKLNPVAISSTVGMTSKVARFIKAK